MQLPKYHETYLSILKVLSSGHPMSANELYKRVRDEYYGHLPMELLAQKTKSSDKLVIIDRIGWGKSYLKLGGFVEYPSRGMVQITDKGKNILETGVFTKADMDKDPDFQAHKIERTIRRSNGTGVAVSENEASPRDLIDEGFSLLEAEAKRELMDRVLDMDPYKFETLVLDLLDKMGYGECHVTQKSGDGGIDGIINQDQLGLDKIYMQAKRYRENKVREPDIRNFIGAMAGDTTKGIFVTTSDFDVGAVQKARDARHTIILINGSKLVDLMHQHGIGTQVRTTYEVKEVDDEYFEVG